MFGHKAKPCMVYKFGSLTPITDDTEMQDELYYRNRYWNELAVMDRLNRQKYLEIVQIPGDIEAAHIGADIESLRMEINKLRQNHRTSVVNTDDIEEEIKLLKEEQEALWAKNKIDRQPIKEARAAEIEILEAERRAIHKCLRSECNLHHHNYDDIDMFYNSARSAAMKKGHFLRPHRFDGSGRIAVRLRGMKVSDAYREGSNRLFQIKPVDPRAWTDPIRANRRKFSRTTAKIRVRSDGNSRPVWIEFPIVMHRPLPPDGEIRTAALNRERVGRKFRYSLDLTVTIPDRQIEEREKFGREAAITRPSVGINVGWRLKKDRSLRVAYWVKQNGEHGELVIPADIVELFEKVPGLQATRDMHFNSIKDALSLFLKENPVPTWLTERTQNLSYWRSPKKMMGVIYAWRENRFDGDQEILDRLEFWRKRENHLYDWQANLLDQTIKHRNEIYRIFAKNLVDSCGQIFVEKFHVSNVAKKSKPEKGPRLTLPADRQRVIAAVSTLRGAIKNAASREGITFKYSDAKNISKECHICGHKAEWDTSLDIMRTCSNPKCMETWDQDFNAATLNLRRSLKRLAEEPEPALV